MNRRIKKLVIICLTALLLLSGCGGTKEYISSDGIVVDVDASWKQLETENAAALLYGENTSENGMVDLCLTQDDAMLTIEKWDSKENISGQRELVQWLHRQYQIVEPNEVDTWLSEAGSEDRLISAYREAAMAEDVNEETLLWLGQLTDNKQWKARLQEESDGYEWIGEEEILFLGQRALLNEYTYLMDGETMHFYDVTVITPKETMYMLNIWAKEKEFEKNKQDYYDIIVSAHWKE